MNAQELVRREVFYCVSSLVNTLAKPRPSAGLPMHLRTLTEQAAELAAPIDDWEEAAIEAGWSLDPKGGFTNIASAIHEDGSDWRNLCETHNLEPYAREVFEHWIVSDWLADKLEAKGEKVDRDFAGMIVWARTTTGQAIYADSLFEDIAREVSL